MTNASWLTLTRTKLQRPGLFSTLVPSTQPPNSNAVLSQACAFVASPSPAGQPSVTSQPSPYLRVPQRQYARRFRKFEGFLPVPALVTILALPANIADSAARVGAGAFAAVWLRCWKGQQPILYALAALASASCPEKQYESQTVRVSTCRVVCITPARGTAVCVCDVRCCCKCACRN